MPLTFADCGKACGKPHVLMRNLQQALGLPLPDKVKGRARLSYICFLQGVAALRAFSIPIEDIAGLLEKEKSVLRLLKMDALDDSPAWYLAHCHERGRMERRLFLTGYNVGFPVAEGAIQTNLDFGSREKELFSGREMGEDVRRALDDCNKAADDIKRRVSREKAVLRNALKWARERGAR